MQHGHQYIHAGEPELPSSLIQKAILQAHRQRPAGTAHGQRSSPSRSEAAAPAIVTATPASGIVDEVISASKGSAKSQNAQERLTRPSSSPSSWREHRHQDRRGKAAPAVAPAAAFDTTTTRTEESKKTAEAAAKEAATATRMDDMDASEDEMMTLFADRQPYSRGSRSPAKLQTHSAVLPISRESPQERIYYERKQRHQQQQQQQQQRKQEKSQENRSKFGTTMDYGRPPSARDEETTAKTSPKKRKDAEVEFSRSATLRKVTPSDSSRLDAAGGDTRKVKSARGHQSYPSPVSPAEYKIKDEESDDLLPETSKEMTNDLTYTASFIKHKEQKISEDIRNGHGFPDLRRAAHRKNSDDKGNVSRRHLTREESFPPNMGRHRQQVELQSSTSETRAEPEEESDDPLGLFIGSVPPSRSDLLHSRYHESSSSLPAVRITDQPQRTDLHDDAVTMWLQSLTRPRITSEALPALVALFTSHGVRTQGELDVLVEATDQVQDYWLEAARKDGMSTLWESVIRAALKSSRAYNHEQTT